jgi:hypothetical protein
MTRKTAAQPRESYSGPLKSEFLKDKEDEFAGLKSAGKDLDSVKRKVSRGEAELAEAKRIAEDRSTAAREDRHAESTGSSVSSSEQVESIDDGSVTFWGDDLEDTKNPKDTKFDPKIKPESNAAGKRGFIDDEGRKRVVLTTHRMPPQEGETEGKVAYVVRRINPNWVRGGGDTHHNSKYIDEPIDAEKLHAQFDRGEFKPAHVGWHDGNGATTAHEERAYMRDLEEVQDTPESKRSIDDLSKRQKISMNAKGFRHYNRHKEARHDATNKATAGTLNALENPEHNVGKGYIDETGRQHMITGHDWKNDDEDHYTTESIDSTGNLDTTGEIGVNELYSQLLDKDSPVTGADVKWHPDHNSNAADRANHAKAQAMSQSGLPKDKIKEAAKGPKPAPEPDQNSPSDKPVAETPGEEGVKEVGGSENAEFTSPKDKHLRENVIKAGGTPRENIQVKYSDSKAEGAHPSVKKGAIRVGKSQKELPVKYGLVHIDDILPSHRDEAGAKGLVSNEDKGYPSAGQHRKGQYETVKAKRRINKAAEAPGLDEDGNPRGFIPEAIGDPSHNPNDGPPTIYRDGVVAAGTNRAGILKRLFKEGRGKYLTEHLKREAKLAGLNPEDIEDGNVLVRVIQKNHHDVSGEELASLSRDLNPEVSAGKNKATQAADLSNQLGPVLKHLSEFHVDHHGTINSFINSKEGKPIRKVIEDIVGESNPDWVDEDTNLLTPDGKAPFNRALAVSALNGNSKLYNFLNKRGVKKQADKYHTLAPYVLAAPLVVKEGGEKFDLSKELELAADAYKAVRNHREALSAGPRQKFNNLSSAEQLAEVVSPPQGQLLGENSEVVQDHKPKDPHPIESNPLSQWLYHALFEGSLGQGTGTASGEDTAGKFTSTGIKDLFKNYLGTLQTRKQFRMDLEDQDVVSAKFPDSAIEALRTAYKEKTGEDAPEGAWGIDSEALDKHATEKGSKPEPAGEVVAETKAEPEKKPKAEAAASATEATKPTTEAPPEKKAEAAEVETPEGGVEEVETDDVVESEAVPEEPTKEKPKKKEWTREELGKREAKPEPATDHINKLNKLPDGTSIYYEADDGTPIVLFSRTDGSWSDHKGLQVGNRSIKDAIEARDLQVMQPGAGSKHLEALRGPGASQNDEGKGVRVVPHASGSFHDVEVTDKGKRTSVFEGRGEGVQLSQAQHAGDHILRGGKGYTSEPAGEVPAPTEQEGPQVVRSEKSEDQSALKKKEDKPLPKLSKSDAKKYEDRMASYEAKSESLANKAKGCK